MGNPVKDITAAMAKGVKEAASHSAKAAASANGVSAAAQSAQGQFNQNSANNANAIGSQRIADQYGFNAGQAAMANQFSSDMWDKSAAWNEMMWQRQADFNAAEAEKQRQWSQWMESTRYQRGMKDMQKAGLNPILAYGGIATGAGSGGAASVGSASMGTISGQGASGGIVNGLSASEGNYTGQMEYMSGMLGLFGAAIDGISAAQKYMAELYKQEGGNGWLTEMVKAFTTVMNPDSWNYKNPDAPINNPNTKFNTFKRDLSEWFSKKYSK